MDIVFKCPNCDQELEVDASATGSTIECPACSASITVPDTEPVRSVAVTVAPVEPPPASANHEERHHFSVPVHETPVEALITKPKPPLEVAAKESDKKMRIKTFKRSDCQEVGKDHFDERVSQFLDKVGQSNVISINTVTYSFIEMGSHSTLTDYGVLIVFRG
jgi:hypothetical protein